jgi:SET domain-containing protein
MKTDPDKYKPYIDDLIHHVYCRIQPSKVHGVGVFAIRDIPKGTEVFKSMANHSSDPEISVPAELIFQNSKIEPGVKQIIKDFMTFHDGQVDMLFNGLNEINISFYLNHSNTPNINTEDGLIFTAKRDIKAGEELFSDYHQYTEEDLVYVNSK